MTVLERHPSWSQCPVCSRYFTADSGFDAHMTSATSRTCRDPARVREGNRRLVFDDVYQAWRWQKGDRPPARRTPPPRPGGRAGRPAGAGRQVGGEGGAAVEGKRRGPAATPTPSRRPVLSRKAKPSLPHGADGGPSLAELAELTGARPGEVLAALWTLREAERERRP